MDGHRATETTRPGSLVLKDCVGETSSQDVLIGSAMTNAIVLDDLPSSTSEAVALTAADKKRRSDTTEWSSSSSNSGSSAATNAKRLRVVDGAHDAESTQQEDGGEGATAQQKRVSFGSGDVPMEQVATFDQHRQSGILYMEESQNLL